MASDNRRITVGAVGYKPDVVKQPGDAWFIVFDFASWLGTTTTVTSVSTPVWNPVTSAPTAGTPTVVETNKAVQIKVSGGTAGYLGVMTFDATMADGQIKEVEVQVAVKEVDWVTTS